MNLSETSQVCQFCFQAVFEDISGYCGVRDDVDASVLFYTSLVKCILRRLGSPIHELLSANIHFL